MDRLLPWLRGTGVVYVLVAVGLAALAWRMAGGSPASTPRPDAPPDAVRLEAGAAEGGVLVHVAGAVRRPGVYRLPGAARVEAAVTRAGGATRAADLAGLNLAARLEDGQQVVVPRRGPAGGAAAGGTAGTQGPLSLSSASAEQLDAIDGIGPTLAARIVEWRRQHGGFASVDQLLDVPGIGEGRLDALKGAVVP
jgi:competence protein ComEA